MNKAFVDQFINDHKDMPILIVGDNMELYYCGDMNYLFATDERIIIVRTNVKGYVDRTAFPYEIQYMDYDTIQYITAYAKNYDEINTLVEGTTPLGTEDGLDAIKSKIRKDPRFKPHDPIGFSNSAKREYSMATVEKGK